MMKGFTLIETIFSVTIFTLVALGVHEGYQALYRSMEASEQKLSALEIASTEFERARSLAHEAIVPSLESLERNGFIFDVSTTVIEEADYKLMEVLVDCDLCRNFNPVTLTGRFAP